MQVSVWRVSSTLTSLYAWLNNWGVVFWRLLWKTTSLVEYIVCVCLYSSTLKVSSVCKMSETYLRGTDQRCFVVSIIPYASAKFLHLHFWKCHITPPKMKLQHADKLERNNMIYLAREKMIYFDMGYKSASEHNRWVTKRY